MWFRTWQQQTCPHSILKVSDLGNQRSLVTFHLIHLRFAIRLLIAVRGERIISPSSSICGEIIPQRRLNHILLTNNTTNNNMHSLEHPMSKKYHSSSIHLQLQFIRQAESSSSSSSSQNQEIIFPATLNCSSPCFGKAAATTTTTISSSQITKEGRSERETMTIVI